MNGGQRSYDSTQGALSLFLNETSIATIKDLGSSEVWEIEIGDDSSIFCISNDGAEPTLKANITNPTGYSDCYHTSNDAQNATSEPLYPVENYRVSLDLKFLAPHDDPNPLSVLNYGVLSDQFIEENFWDVKYDASKQELHLFSTFFEHEDDNPALTVSNVTEDKWYKLDLVFDELGVTIYLDSERASETAIWKNVEELNDIKDSKITGFQISDSGINMLIDQLWISSEASNPKDGRSVSSVDITNSKNWIGRIGHWMAEQSGIWVQPTGLAFSVISNNQVGWDGDKIEIGVEGLETFMQKFGAGTTEDIIIDDNDDPISWHNYEACQWEGATFAGNIRWYCQDEPDKQTQIVSNITLTSVGAGAIGVTALLLIYPKMKIKNIIGTDIAHAVPLTLFAGLGHYTLGNVDTILLVSLLIGSIPGVWIGSSLSSKIDENKLRYILVLILLGVGIKLILN